MKELQEIFDRLFVKPVKVTSSLSPEDVEEWDSLLHLSLLSAVEKRFGFRFLTGEAEGARTVGALAELINDKLRVR